MAVKIALAAGLAIMSAGMAIYQGKQQAAAARFEEEQAKRNAEIQKMNADIDEAERRRQLGSVLSTARAQAAARGYDLGASGSFTTLQAETQRNAEQDMKVSRLNWLSSAENWQMRAANARAAGRGAEIGGFVKAGVSLAGFAYNAYTQGLITPPSVGSNSTAKTPRQLVSNSALNYEV